jgi:polysaccharide biosynthesis transport protein
MVENANGIFGTENFLREFVFILYYRKRTILTAMGVVFFLAAVAAILLPPTYISTTKYSISVSQQLDPLKREQYSDIKNIMFRVLQSQKEIVLSSDVLEPVVRKTFPDLPQEKIPDMVDRLRKRITVTPPKGEDFEGSNIFNLNVEAHTAAQAHETAVALAAAYLKAYASLANSKSLYSYGFYNDQVEKLYGEMDTKGRKLREFEIKHAANLADILNMEVAGGKPNMEIGPKALLTEASRNRQRLTEQMEAQNKVIEILESEARANAVPVIMADMEGVGKTLTAYRNKVAQLQLQLAEMKTQYTGSFEPMQQLEKELKSTITLLRTEYDAQIKAKKVEVASLDAQIKATSEAIDRLEVSLTSTARERSTYETLKQDYVLARDAYADARSKMEQARLASSLNQEKQDITQVQAPELPLSPAKPNRPLLLALGLFAGLFLGLALALALDYFDHTLKTPEQVEQHLGLPCLGSVGRIG